jgi:hypothetical protein
MGDLSGCDRRDTDARTTLLAAACAGRRVLLLAAVFLFSPGGCASQPPRTHSLADADPGRVDAAVDNELDAICFPPRGWRPEPLERLSHSVQRVWVSPTGHTAYGVIRIRLPLPLGPNLVLWRFVAELRAREGEGRLVSRERNGGEIDFVAEGAEHRLAARLHIDGWKAWVIYAGVLRDGPVDAQELPLAESARDRTTPGTVGQNGAR